MITTHIHDSQNPEVKNFGQFTALHIPFGQNDFDSIDLFFHGEDDGLEALSQFIQLADASLVRLRRDRSVAAEVAAE
jgi:hypothetical protein